MESERECHLASRRLKRRCEHQPPRCARTGTSASGRGTPHRKDGRAGDRPPRRPDRMNLTSIESQQETPRLEPDHPVRVTLGRRRLRRFGGLRERKTRQQRAPPRPGRRRRLRGHRRREEAEEERCRRRPRRQARLPHLPAAPVPGGDGAARADGGRPPDSRPCSQAAERARSPGHGHGDRSRGARGPFQRARSLRPTTTSSSDSAPR